MIYQISSDRPSLDIQGHGRITAQVVNQIDDNGTYQPQILKCWTGSDNWQLALAHELGHILVRIIKPKLHKQYLNDLALSWLCGPTTAIIRHEILAWRICKSILNPKFWNDRAWYWRLNSYWENRYRTTLPEEFKIIEYQKGGNNGISA